MPGPERRLAAILSADVVGSSRLMAEDEDATIRAVTTRREEVELRVRQHRGRLVDFTGDNFLAEFGSAVEALECAVEIQRAITARHADVPAERRMAARLGLPARRLRSRLRALQIRRPEPESLYARLGGSRAIAAFSRDLFGRAIAHPELGRFWRERSRRPISRSV